MTQKLWIAHVTPSKTFGPTKVSIHGCSDVDDFKGAIRKSPELAIPRNTPITLYKSDGTTEIEVGDSPADYLEGNTHGNPLIVCIENDIYEVLISAIDSPKTRRKIDNLIEKSKKYLFKTDRWGCVTVIKKRTAVTFAHGEHQTLAPGSIIKIYSIDENVEYDVKVVQTIAESDWVLLESDVDLCEDEPKKGLTVDGRGYIQLGLSATTQQKAPFSASKGVISSSRLNKFGHLLGSAGANPGNSGGPCFDESTSELIGIHVGCENMDKDTGAQIYDKISHRYASRAHIIPVGSFLFLES